MVNKCKNISEFEFVDDDISIRLYKGNPIHGNRLCIYKNLNKFIKRLIYDEFEIGDYKGGWIDGQYDENINSFVEQLINIKTK